MAHPWFGDASVVREISDRLYRGIAVSVLDRPVRGAWRAGPVERSLLDAVVGRGRTRTSALQAALGELVDQCPQRALPGFLLLDQPSPAVTMPIAEVEIGQSVAGSVLAAVLERDAGDAIGLRPMDVAPLEHLSAAEHLLRTIVPSTYAGAISCVDAVVFVDGGPLSPSASLPGLPGVVFLTRELDPDPAMTAGLVLHEAMHQLCFRIRDVLPFVSPAGRAYEVRASWRQPKGGGDRGPDAGRWPLDRALGALHVFATLEAFYSSPVFADDQRVQALLTDQRRKADSILGQVHALARQLTRSGQEFLRSLAAIRRWDSSAARGNLDEVLDSLAPSYRDAAPLGWGGTEECFAGGRFALRWNESRDDAVVVPVPTHARSVAGGG